MFISRLVRGGLAESTGLLGVNDEILEVNGIDVAGKSLDQVRTPFSCNVLMEFALQKRIIFRKKELNQCLAKHLFYKAKY